MSLRLAFLGTPPFAARILAALLGAGHRIDMVYCQKPRPAGRGHRPLASPVQLAAAAAGLPLRMPERLDAGEGDALAALGLDAAIVAAYGLILPAAMLHAPLMGCLNVHASLLPRWRGAAPIERAILAGDAMTGVTIMQMDEGLDTGAIVLAARGARLVLEALDGLAAGRLVPRPQPEDGASYARKLRREEGRLDWRLPAAQLERAVRALNPAPGVWFDCKGERIKLLAAALAPAPEGVAPGTVLDAAPHVACGAGALRLLVLQRPGRAALPAGEFLRGFALPPGTILPCPASS
jgi:methionyl-tRNA formyltransferase